MQESFWWWQCSDRYNYNLPLPPPPYPLPPVSPSLISFMVSVHVKHHVYLLYQRSGALSISVTEECQKKRKRPVLSKEFTSRGQADLVDMQPTPRNNYKLIMVRCIRTTSRSQSLKNKHPTEVAAAQLMGIFPLLLLRYWVYSPSHPRRKLKTFRLLWLWFMANPVIRNVRDLLNDEMVT